ncbi:MAG: UDP-N-acetylmuramate dehydrogenase [Paludibacteraceae bacterium]|nr:UDP-N-acetylmuramate dehydrogenase [Paludibacteraceae bacterium]
MKISENISVLPNNTFRMDVRARVVAEYATVAELQQLLQRYCGEVLLPVGEGSNLLFTKDFDGVVLISRMCRAKALKETGQEVWVEAESGLKLDDLIAQLADMNLTGLENLSHIPGTVGASAVQNVGAYGVEAKDVIDSIEAVDVHTGEVVTIAPEQCRYGYRDSRFKNEWQGRYIITKVVYRLHKNGPLQTERLHWHEPLNDAMAVREAVTAIRRQKLPEVSELGSAGSFFKNPVIPVAHYERLKEQWATIPHYDETDGVKIPAAWLIEQCGWKGKTIGGAQVYDRQPLVIVNRNHATPEDITELAAAISRSVEDKFGITISPEVNYI